MSLMMLEQAIGILAKAAGGRVDPSRARNNSSRSRRRVMRVTPAIGKETDDLLDYSNSARVTLREIVSQRLSVAGCRLKVPTRRLVATAEASQ